MRNTVNPSVILSTGGCASVHAGIDPPQRAGTLVPCQVHPQQVQPPPGQVHPPAGRSPGRYISPAGTPPRQVPPGQVTPQGRYTLPPPTDGHCSARYASYWNAFLFNKLSTGNTVFTCPKKLNIYSKHFASNHRLQY